MCEKDLWYHVIDTSRIIFRIFFINIDSSLNLLYGFSPGLEIFLSSKILYRAGLLNQSISQLLASFTVICLENGFVSNINFGWSVKKKSHETTQDIVKSLCAILLIERKLCSHEFLNMNSLVVVTLINQILLFFKNFLMYI